MNELNINANTAIILMKKLLFILSLLMLSVGVFAKGGRSDKVVTFKFVPGEDMFYILWEWNNVQLDARRGTEQ